ncbi:SDR family oxidoreductase [Bacteroides sp. An322]|uniref:SDR family NAD(P)-dependent oxidoreductase n=1 Tax=Bacteroides sp. An322 TaxID=1965632 RepID=UPI000B3A6A92|nr:SDR family oxidoreductase [Bacteroides sp. An322]OUO20545.1 3-oxoacyl-ACP reductase [Bacteroides sp. An322]
MYNPFSLLGKRILVTGASSGIGRAIAIECSRMGANVILTARNEERLNETLQQMDNIQLHQIIVADLSNMDDIKTLVDSMGNPLDGIVQCAGFTVPKPFQFVNQKDIDSIMAVNFMAPAILSQMLLKKKMLNKGASIVFISSISGVWVSYVGSSLYSASKGAVNGLVKGMAIELAAKSIRVNCVNPGMVETNILEKGIISDEQLHNDMQLYPLKRHGKPEEIAYAVIYLLSDASAWVTGTNLLIDGGYTLL